MVSIKQMVGPRAFTTSDFPGLKEEGATAVGLPPASARDFLCHCLEADPERRWACAELLRHPFLQATSDGALLPVLKFMGHKLGGV